MNAQTQARARSLAPFVLIGIALAVVGLLSQSPGGGAPLDPNGTSPGGAKALVLLLRQYGAEVQLVDGVPAADVPVAVVLNDETDAPRREALARWVEGGGRLVVADPSSTMQIGAPVRAATGFTSTDQHPQGPCALPGLESVGRLDVGPSDFLRPPASGSGDGCFEHDGAFFLVTAEFGHGLVVGLGGAGVWINSRLAHDDNAALAIDLLMPGGATRGARIAVLTRSQVGSGGRSVLSLLGPRVKPALLQLLIAFALLAWWRGRRFGRPVAESLPVKLAGSEIVVAVGDLLQRAGNRDAAARQLRDGLRRWLAERLGLDPHTPGDQVAAAVSARTGADRGRVADLLTDSPVGDADDLVRLAQSLARLRTEVAGAPH